MGHTAQAIMLSLSVPNDSYTAHLLSELWEIQGGFWWCPNSHSMFAAALQRQIRRTARREVNHCYMRACFSSMPTGCRNARVLYIFCRKSTYSDFHFICITVQILPPVSIQATQETLKTVWAVLIPWKPLYLLLQIIQQRFSRDFGRAVRTELYSDREKET